MSVTAPHGSINLEDPLKFQGHLWSLSSVECIPITLLFFSMLSGFIPFFPFLEQVQQLLEYTMHFNILLLFVPTINACPDMLL